MKEKLLWIAVITTLIYTVLLSIGIFNDSYVWPIFKVRIGVLHLFALAVMVMAINMFKYFQIKQ